MKGFVQIPVFQFCLKRYEYQVCHHRAVHCGDEGQSHIRTDSRRIVELCKHGDETGESPDHAEGRRDFAPVIKQLDTDAMPLLQLVEIIVQNTLDDIGIGTVNVEIRNGTIRDFGYDAIYDQHSDNSSGHRVIEIRALSNGHGGIVLPDSVNHLIKNCTENMPPWNTTNIFMYGISEAGATPVQELAYGLAWGKSVIDACKEVGLVEYTTFATTVDPRIETRCIACPPDQHPANWWCTWEFTLADTS